MLIAMKKKRNHIDGSVENVLKVSSVPIYYPHKSPQKKKNH
jgi:hypothetical protein